MPLKVENICVSIAKNTILKDIACSFKKGEVTAIIGPNGCGKSTLIKTLARVLKPNNGKIFILDKNIYTLSSKEVAKRIGVLAQTNYLDEDINVYEFVSLGRYPYQGFLNKYTKEDFNIINQSLEIVDLKNLQNKKLSTLSGGQKQRCFIAMVLAQGSDILLLDEPTTYLDWYYQIDIINLIKTLSLTYKKTIITVLHDINHVLMCANNVICLKDGKIILNGKVTDIINKQNIKTIFNVDVNFIKDKQTTQLFCYSQKTSKTN